MSETNELQPCPCGGPDCEGDNLSHHCGGPREACGVPGCLECGAPSPDTAQLLARVAELEAALRGVFEWKEEISADLRLHTNPDPILDAVERALSGTTSTLDTLIADAVKAEREACAEVCLSRERTHRNDRFNAKLLPEEEEAGFREDEAANCAAAIRARTNQPTNQPTDRGMK